VQSSSQNLIITISKPTPNILQAGCPFCCPTNSVKALKENWKKQVRAEKSTIKTAYTEKHKTQSKETEEKGRKKEEEDNIRARRSLV